MKPITRLIIICAILFGISEFVWQWGFCRFYVEPGYMAIVTAKTGDDLPPDQILAKAGQKGIQEVVLGEGRHFLNPVIYDHVIRAAIERNLTGERPESDHLYGDGRSGKWIAELLASVL